MAKLHFAAAPKNRKILFLKLVCLFLATIEIMALQHDGLCGRGSAPSVDKKGSFKVLALQFPI